jgi:hypothetical protein
MELPSTAKVEFLAGFVEGYNAATPSGITLELRKLVGEAKAADAYKALMTGFSLRWFFPEKTPLGEMATGIDGVYANP